MKKQNNPLHRTTIALTFWGTLLIVVSCFLLNSYIQYSLAGKLKPVYPLSAIFREVFKSNVIVNKSPLPIRPMTVK
jgi:hypothetical protein